MITDREISAFLYARLVDKYGENPNYDYMLHLQRMATSESCPGDERCICRSWASAAKVGIKNGVFFESLRLIGSDVWRATGTRTEDRQPVIAEAKDHPAEAIRKLEDAILRDRQQRHGS